MEFAIGTALAAAVLLSMHSSKTIAQSVWERLEQIWYELGRTSAKRWQLDSLYFQRR